MSIRRRRLHRIEGSLRILLVAAAFVATLFVARVARALGCVDGGPALTITAMTMEGSSGANPLPPGGTQTYTASGGSGIGYTWGGSGGFVSATTGSTTMFTAGLTAMEQVTVTDSDMCTAYLTVYVATVLSITPSTATVAPGDMLTFTGTGGSPPYKWLLLESNSGMASISPGATTVAYKAGAMAGKDEIELTDSIGDTAYVSILVATMVPLGTACSTSDVCAHGSNGQGNCVDGVCCNTACSGQCQACNTANSVGMCVTISGIPVNSGPGGTRQACSQGNAQNVCSAKICDGTSPTACTSFVGATVMCALSSCVDQVGTPAAVCDDDGGCPTVVPSSCSPFACVQGACATACTDSSECSPGNYCDVTTGKCVEPTDAGSADGMPVVPSPPAKSSGCATGSAGASGGVFLVLGLVGLAGLRRRRAAASDSARTGRDG